MKICTKCNQEKDESQFVKKKGTDKPISQCKSCRAKENRERRAKEKAKGPCLLQQFINNHARLPRKAALRGSIVGAPVLSHIHEEEGRVITEMERRVSSRGSFGHPTGVMYAENKN